MEVSDLLLTTPSESLKSITELNQSISTLSSIGDQLPKDGCHQFRFVFYVLFASTVGLLGLLGNALSFIILGQDRGSAVAAFQLRSLAVADSLFLLLWLVNYSLRFAMEPIGQHLRTAWLYVRLVAFPFLYMAQSGTIWLTVVVAFNRYVAVCLPYRAHLFGNMSLVRKQVVGVTVAAIVYNVPRFFELKVVDAAAGGNGTTTWNRTELGHSKVYRIIYTDTLYYLLTFIVPLVTLACMNTRVIVTYRETCRRRRGMSSRSTTDQEQSITLVMIVIVLVFLACQTPAKIVQMVWAYSFSDCRQLRFYLIHVSNVLEVLNSSVNFLIYSAFYRHFRTILLSWVCCRRPIGRAGNCETVLDDNTIRDDKGTLKNLELRCNYSVETVLMDATVSSSQ